MSKLRQGLENIGQYVIEELAKEIIKQDHSNTGKLIDSLDYQVDNTLITILMNDYGRYVNTGRKRGAKKVPIKALVEWIKQRGIESNNKKAIGIAFAIQKTIEREGIPTVRSRQKGKRVEFVDDTVDRIEPIVVNMLSDLYEEEINLQIDNLVKRI